MPYTPVKEEIQFLIDLYAKSISDADIKLAERIWSTTEDVSFVHPKGHHRGWSEIRDDFYKALMRDKFIVRKLRVYDLEIQCSDKHAIAVFYWEFNATWQDNGTPQHSEGR